MSKVNEREQKLRYIFGQHPKTDIFHVTSDDHAFFQASDAQRHAQTLEDKTVDEVHRRDVIQPEKPAAPKTTKTPAKGKAPAKGKTTAKGKEPKASKAHDAPEEGGAPGEAGADAPETGKE